MAVDPRVKAFLDSPLATHPPYEQFGAAGLRAMMAQYPAPVLAPPVHSVTELSVPGAQGPLRVRLYRPSAARDLPLIVYFHGGGFVICTLEMYDDSCRMLANYSGCAVARSTIASPPRPLSGPLEDCYAALKTWRAAVRNWASTPAGLPWPVTVPAATSRPRPRSWHATASGPALRFQGLIYPCVDPSCSSASQNAFAEGYMLTRAGMLWYWSSTFSRPPTRQPVAAPGQGRPQSAARRRACITAEYDPLRDEGEDYADRLRAAGVEVTGRRYLGMIHGFASMPYCTPDGEPCPRRPRRGPAQRADALAFHQHGRAVPEQALVRGDADLGTLHLARAGLPAQLPHELAHLRQRLRRHRLAEAGKPAVRRSPGCARRGASRRCAAVLRPRRVRTVRCTRTSPAPSRRPGHRLPRATDLPGPTPASS